MQLFRIKGQIEFELRYYSKAIDTFNTYLKFDSKDAEIWALKGNAYYEQKEYRKAYVAFVKSLKLNPKNGIVQNNKLKAQ